MNNKNESLRNERDTHLATDGAQNEIFQFFIKNESKLL